MKKIFLNNAIRRSNYVNKDEFTSNEEYEIKVEQTVNLIKFYEDNEGVNKKLDNILKYQRQKKI